jgi:anti-sigma factor RsiW
MTISDETLMAYADGELDPAARQAVESAMRESPEIDKRVAQHRALRARVQAAYSAELSEEVPERLLVAANRIADTKGSEIVDLRDARAALGRSARPSRALRPKWWTSGLMAASLVAGLGLGFFMWGETPIPLMRSAGGALIARGQLANALSNQLAAEQSPTFAVRIGLSFLAKSGNYCRTFALPGAVPTSGLACHHGKEWRVQALNQEGDGTGGDGKYRTAGSAMSASILKSVEAEIAGEPLDQAGEQDARRRGWQPAGR